MAPAIWTVVALFALLFFQPSMFGGIEGKLFPVASEIDITQVDGTGQNSVEQMREALTTLKSGANNLTGPVVGKIPDFLATAFNPKSVATREAVEEIVQRNLRLVLGAQFTEKEGTRLIARAYNPQLQEPENAKRVQRLLSAIESGANSRDAAAKYFQTRGTLDGWNGSLPTVDDIDAAIEGGDASDADYLRSLGLQ